MNIKITSANRMKVADGLTGSGFSYQNAERDANYVPVMWGVSDLDGVTPIPIYGDPATGQVLIRTV